MQARGGAAASPSLHLTAETTNPVAAEPHHAHHSRRPALGFAPHRSHTQRREQLAAGAAYNDLGLLFCQPDGSPIHPDRLTKQFAQRVRRAGVPRIRLHDLRHTHATIGLLAGVHPKVMSERLGHSSVAITLDVYSHAVPALEEEAAERVAGLVFGS